MQWIAIEVFGLIVSDVHVFETEAEAEEWFQSYTGRPYPRNDAEWEAMSETEYDQTKIFGKEV